MLDALTEVAFEPEFLPSRIEKERKAVVAEAQVRRAGAPLRRAAGLPAAPPGLLACEPKRARNRARNVHPGPPCR